MGKITINPYLFRSLDIRGANPEYVKSQNIVRGSLREKSAHGSVLSPEIANIIGRAIAVAEKPKKVVVGYDARLSSSELTKSLVKGLTEQGIDVDLIGLVTVDKLYFSIGYYKYDLGIMTTGSHAIKEINGFKISRYKDGKVIPVASGTGMEELKKTALAQEFPKPLKRGIVSNIDVSEDFKNHILSFFDMKKLAKQKIIFDASNGPAGITHESIIDSLPIEAIKLNFKPDGNFPNHEPDPMIAENLKELIEKLKSEDADFGVAWDGDADRVAVIRKNGEILTGSFIAPIIALWVLKKHPHATLVITPPMSWATRDIVRKENAKIEYAKVGNSFVKMAMEQFHSPFAAEEADHFMFAETYNAESGIFPLLIILNLIHETGKSFDQLLDELVGDYIITGDINIEVKNPNKVLQKVEEKYNLEGSSVSKLDGISVEFDDWHFALRPSLNDPVVRLNLEAKSKEKRDTETEKLRKLIIEADK